MSLDPETLLGHADFVRAVAFHLIRDAQAAEDVAQETWMAAMKNPPAPGRSLRNWLGGIARNITFSMMRERKRRHAVEHSMPGPRASRSTAEVWEREATRRRMVEAVLNLPDPYRSALLYRFYDDMLPREIAQHLDVPVNTIRTHIQRGLERLKKELDREYGGDRQSWCMALAPIAGIKLLSPAAGTTAIMSSAGAMIMSTKMKLVLTLISAALIFCAGTMLWDAPWRNDPGDRIGDDKTAMDQSSSNSPQADGKGVPVAQTHEKAEDSVSLAPMGTFISGRIIDQVTGNPVTAFDLRLFPKHNTEGRRIHETIVNEGGRFLVPLDNGGDYQIQVQSSRHLDKTVYNLKVPQEVGLDGVTIALDPGRTVSGRVIEADSGRPMANVMVLPVFHPFDGAGLELYNEGFQEACSHTFTDAFGRFTLQGLEFYTAKAVAFCPGYAQAWGNLWVDELELVLERGHSLYGKVLSDQGEPLPGVTVTMLGDNFPLVTRYETGPDGGFRTDPSLPGRIHILADVKSKMFAKESQTVVLIDKDLEVNFGIMEDYVTWRGTLFDHDGHPSMGGRVNISPDYSYPWPYISEGLCLFRREMECDGEGVFEGNKLPPGRYWIEISQGDSSERNDWGYITLDNPGLVLKDLHPPSSGVCGEVIDEYTGELVKRGKVIIEEQEPGENEYSGSIDSSGQFKVKGVKPGVYVLSALAPKRQRGRLKGVRVEKDRITEGLRLTIPAQGLVNIKLTGFKEKAEEGKHVRFRYTFFKEGNYLQNTGHTEVAMDLDGTEKINKPLSAGRWTISLCIPGISGSFYIDRSFEIHPEKTTHVLIERDDFQGFEGTVMVSGSVFESDGSAGGPATLHFTPTWTCGRSLLLGGHADTVAVECDGQGRYQKDGFRPGWWEVRLVFESGDEIALPYLFLPANPPNPFYVNLHVPGGSVKGSFWCNEANGSSLSWAITLLDHEKKYKKLHKKQGVGTAQFHLEGVAAGRYMLKANVLGFNEYTSHITLTENQHLDMGKIPLTPCGALILEVVDEQGSPVQWPALYFNDQECRPREYDDWLCSIRCTCDHLPIGPVKLKIMEPGFEDRTIDLMLKPGVPEKVRVVMKRYH